MEEQTLSTKILEYYAEDSYSANLDRYHEIQSEIEEQAEETKEVSMNEL